MKDLFKKFGVVILSLLVIAAALSFSQVGKENPKKTGINTLVNKIQQEKVESVTVQGDIMTVKLKDQSRKLSVKKSKDQSFSELMSNYGIDPKKLSKVEVTIEGQSGWKYWLGALAPYIFPLLILGAIIYFMTRQVKGMNNRAMGFGKDQSKKAEETEDTETTFDDVAGLKEAKEELEEVVDFLQRPKQFSEMGAEIPKGVLLMGEPGTGKTLMAKAVAGEADVPFFHISGSEFVEMFVGVGASRVRDLFEKAKKKAPAIIFIDELDAVGRKRGAGVGGSHDEREQTLNQILVEMDGFDPHLGVIVMAATNRPDILDQALLRPGRFDRQITVGKPDIREREEILKIHAKDKPFKESVDFRAVAERTPGFSGADLENLLNEAAILAVRKGKDKIGQEMIFECIERVLMGPSKESKVMTDEEREMTAYHEAGHAIVGNFLEHCDPVRKVSIIGRGKAGGYTLSMPEEDENYKTLRQLKDKLAMMMGGYVVEKKIYGDESVSTGPSNDLQKATQVASKMVKRYGMSDSLAPRSYGENDETIFLAQEIHEEQDYSEETASKIDKEINAILTEARDRARKIVDEKEDELEELVRTLLEKETIEKEEFDKIMEGEVVLEDEGQKEEDKKQDLDEQDNQENDNTSEDKE
ncbi:MAG: ATP-dependent zinc metalloprotease FtsH [Candidatus Magasanikbacteria bacterium]